MRPAPLLFVLLCSVHTGAQTTASLEGQVMDQNGAVVPAVEIKAICRAIAVQRSTISDDGGRYQITALPVGDYRLEVRSRGFQMQILENVHIEVSRRIRQDFRLSVGEPSEQVTVTSTNGLIEQASVSVGHVIDRGMVQELPLNGRYFLDLGLLVLGSVTPAPTAFSTLPSRGVGALAINTAGNREETVNFMINGVTLNNMVFSSITFQPSIDTVQEFRVDNSTFSAEYGQNSGAIVNIATRSGMNEFHGEVFEFLRNDALDARNFFNFTSPNPPPFKRNQFGGHLGGPIVKNRAFFFFSYEGLRQSQGTDLNSLVLEEAQRLSVTDPVIVMLVHFIPRANFVDSSGASRFIGSAAAPVDVDQWTLDITYNLTPADRLHGYYANHDTVITEPNRFGNTIPGFGHSFAGRRQLLTVNETHTFGPRLVNEARFGFNRVYGINLPNASLNPAEFGIQNGRSEPTGLLQINIAGGLNFGGPSSFPAGRGDTTFVVADALSLFAGGHSLKLGAELNHITSGTRFPTGGSGS